MQPLPTLSKIVQWKYSQICMYSFKESKSYNLAYCSSLQTVVVYNFREIVRINYVADCW